MLEIEDWINVVPLTVAGRIVMIRQYRHGIGEVGLEIPGRVIDHGGGPQVAHAGNCGKKLAMRLGSSRR